MIDELQKAVTALPHAIPKALRTHVLAAYNRDPSELVADRPTDIGLWEHFDGVLNVLIPQEIEEVKKLVVRGKHGIQGLVNLLKHLIDKHGIIGGVLNGKVDRIMWAINE